MYHVLKHRELAGIQEVQIEQMRTPAYTEYDAYGQHANGHGGMVM